MANISNKEILAVLEKADGWLTFDQVYDAVLVEYECVAFSGRMQRLVWQGRIQYIPAQGMDRALYGRLGLEKPLR